MRGDLGDAEIAELQAGVSRSDDGLELGDVVVNLASGHLSLLNSKVRLQSGAALGLKLDEETYKAESRWFKTTLIEKHRPSGGRATERRWSGAKLSVLLKPAGEERNLNIWRRKCGGGLFRQWTHSLSDGSAGECKPFS